MDYRKWFWLFFGLASNALLIAVIVVFVVPFNTPDAHLSVDNQTFNVSDSLEVKGSTDGETIYIRSDLSLLDYYVVCSHELLHVSNPGKEHRWIAENHLRWSRTCYDFVGELFSIKSWP